MRSMPVNWKGGEELKSGRALLRWWKWVEYKNFLMWVCGRCSKCPPQTSVAPCQMVATSSTKAASSEQWSLTSKKLDFMYTLYQISKIYWFLISNNAWLISMYPEHLQILGNLHMAWLYTTCVFECKHHMKNLLDKDAFLFEFCWCNID